MAKTKYVTMRLEEDVYSHLKEIAVREHRTLSNLLSLIMWQAVEKDKIDYNIGGVREDL